MVRSEVPTGRRINGAEIFIALVGGCRSLNGIADVITRETASQSIEGEIDHGRGVESQ